MFKAVYSRENWILLKNAWHAKGFSGVKYLLKSKRGQQDEPDFVQENPAILHIETTSRCNLRCPSCAHSEKGGAGEDMTFENFVKFVDQFDYVAKVILYGIGEPTMHRDIFKMVDYCKKRKIFCGFFTNGTLLTERNREQILECDQDYLNLSIDGAYKESFEKLRAGANFEKVVSNIQAMTDLLKNNGSKMEVAVWNCLTEDNVHELPELVRLTHRLGIKKLVVQDIMFWNSKGIEENFSDKTMDLKAASRKTHFDEAQQLAKEFGIQFDIMMSAGDGKRRCKLPWFFSYITATGLATPCNWHGWDGSKMNFGNVFEKPFREIWNNSAYQDFRKEMRRLEQPSFCEQCPMYDRVIKRLA